MSQTFSCWKLSHAVSGLAPPSIKPVRFDQNQHVTILFFGGFFFSTSWLMSLCFLFCSSVSLSDLLLCRQQQIRKQYATSGPPNNIHTLHHSKITKSCPSACTLWALCCPVSPRWFTHYIFFIFFKALHASQPPFSTLSKAGCSKTVLQQADSSVYLCHFSFAWFAQGYRRVLLLSQRLADWQKQVESLLDLLGLKTRLCKHDVNTFN